MTFTDEQIETLESGGVVSVNINGIECVVLRKDVYEKFKLIIEFDDSEMAPEETYSAVLRAWDDAGSAQDATLGIQ